MFLFNRSLSKVTAGIQTDNGSLGTFLWYLFALPMKEQLSWFCYSSTYFPPFTIVLFFITLPTGITSFIVTTNGSSRVETLYPFMTFEMTKHFDHLTISFKFTKLPFFLNALKLMSALIITSIIKHCRKST